MGEWSGWGVGPRPRPLPASPREEDLAPLGRWVRFTGLWSGAEARLLVWWLLADAVEDSVHLERWAAESVEEVGFVVHHYCCVRCGRQHISAHTYPVGDDRRHWCDKPYFRPRSVHHPLGDGGAGPRLLDVARIDPPDALSGRVRAPASPRGGEPIPGQEALL